MTYCLSVLSEIDAMVRRSHRILIASDFDGTLCPIAETPSEVKLTSGMLALIHTTIDCPRLKLAVISGRALDDIAKRLPSGLILAGNHGLEICGGGIDFEHLEARQLRPLIADACERLRAVLPAWPAAWIEDKGLSATLHVRRVDQRHQNPLLFTARQALRGIGGKIALRLGRCALEIRPKVSWDKGAALSYIHQKAGPFDCCICLGDDRSDESMFLAECSRLSIRVELTGATSATHYLSDPGDVAIFLSHIIAVCNAEGSSTPEKLAERPRAIAIRDPLLASDARA